MGYDIKLLCLVAQVSRSGYYRWLSKIDQLDKDYDDYLLIKRVFEKGKSKLGWRRIKMVSNNEYNINMNHKKIKRIMKKYGLVAKIRRRNPYKMIMKKTSEHRTFPNILNRKFVQFVPGRVMCTDITYLYYGQGRRAYLQVVKDVATREILSFRLSSNLTMPFVLESIDELKNVSYLTKESILHSDQGVHYTNPEYIYRVKGANLVQSMSRKGNCIDNSPMESFFGHLKDEVDYKDARTFVELHDMISEYISYYNNQRYQWDLKKMTPVGYRNHLLSLA